MAYSSVKHVKHLEKALLRAAQKMTVMALRLEELGNDWTDPAIKIRAEAALAFDALHKEFD